MKINGDTLSGFRAGAKAQFGQARKKVILLQGQASRALRDLAAEGKARRAEWTARVRQLTSTKTLPFDKWQTRIMDAVGIASAGQVQRISRELAKLAKKVESLSSGKSN